MPPRQEAALLLRVSRYLHRLHRTAAEHKRVLEFFHVSKAGGSSLCQLGAANGCVTQVSSHTSARRAVEPWAS